MLARRELYVLKVTDGFFALPSAFDDLARPRANDYRILSTVEVAELPAVLALQGATPTQAAEVAQLDKTGPAIALARAIGVTSKRARLLDPMTTPLQQLATPSTAPVPTTTPFAAAVAQPPAFKPFTVSYFFPSSSIVYLSRN